MMTVDFYSRTGFYIKSITIDFNGGSPILSSGDSVAVLMGFVSGRNDVPQEPMTFAVCKDPRLPHGGFTWIINDRRRK